MDSPESRFHLSSFQMDIAGVNNKNKVNICWENINMGLLNPTQGRERNFLFSLMRFIKPLDGSIWGIKNLLLSLMPINTATTMAVYTSFIPNWFHCTKIEIFRISAAAMKITFQIKEPPIKYHWHLVPSFYGQIWQQVNDRFSPNITHSRIACYLIFLKWLDI